MVREYKSEIIVKRQFYFLVHFGPLLSTLRSWVLHKLLLQKQFATKV